MFWHRETTFSTPQALSSPRAVPWPRAGCEEPGRRLGEAAASRTAHFPLGSGQEMHFSRLLHSPRLGSSYAAARPYFQDTVRVSFSPIVPGMPPRALLLPELCAPLSVCLVGFFSSLMCGCCPNKTTTEYIYLQPPVFKDSKGVCNISETT